jgi:3-oxoacyl-(acyl-carrier-protein) synthase
MIAVSGAGHVVLEPGAPAAADPTRYLREKKTRKFMGLQDELAVVAAGQALEQAGLAFPAGERTGLYVAVGYIPFERRDAAPVLEGSLDASQHFDMQRFADDGYQRAHPLLTFRCLPNMPAYHVSANFGIEGPYFVTYPGAGQAYLALEEACAALEAGVVDVALCGGVAQQRNFLVEHHFARLLPALSAEWLRDASGFLVLERAERAEARGARLLALLEHSTLSYDAFDPRFEQPAARELHNGQACTLELGTAALAVGVSTRIHRSSGAWTFTHQQSTRDGYTCESQWRRP